MGGGSHDPRSACSGWGALRGERLTIDPFGVVYSGIKLDLRSFRRDELERRAVVSSVGLQDVWWGGLRRPAAIAAVWSRSPERWPSVQPGRSRRCSTTARTARARTAGCPT